MVFTHGVGELQAQHFGVELDGFNGVLATKGGVVEFFAQHGVGS